MGKVNNRLGKRLKELRGDRSLYEVGQDANVSRSNIQRYESGNTLPTEAVLERLSVTYQTSYDDLAVLYFADYFDRHPRKRELVIRWVKEYVLGTKEDI